MREGLLGLGIGRMWACFQIGEVRVFYREVKEGGEVGDGASTKFF